MPDRAVHRDLFLARALGWTREQIEQVPEYIREFAITLLLDGEGGDR